MPQEALAITNLLELGHPVITWVVVSIVSLSMLLGLARQFLNFHSRDFVFRKTRNIEASLEKLDKESDEYELMNEILNQELFYANTGLYLTRPERQQVTEWMLKGLVPINYIRKAKSNIGMEDGKLTVIIFKVELLYMWIGGGATVIFIFWVLYMLWLMAVNGASLGVAIQLGILSAVMLYVWRSLDPILYARKIKWRLSEAGILGKESQL